MDYASIMPAADASDDRAPRSFHANFPSKRDIARPYVWEEQPIADRPANDTECESVGALPRSFSLASRIAISRRNTVARRKLETLRDRERLRATLAEVWERNGDALNVMRMAE